DAVKRSLLKFRRGSAEWICGNDDIFYFKRNDSKIIKIMNDGKVKLGSNDPNYKLDVYGDINIPIGYSYLVDGGKGGGKYAEYFEAEEALTIGELVGINLETGLAKKYESGDLFIGIVCNASGFIANANLETIENSHYVLVGLDGLMEYDNHQVSKSGQQLFTVDGVLIGSVIGDQVLMK
ncbi:MAG: hypothetical protein GQ527_06285, partial [Bacteroidales bacterium]|nr:hypothetical protein [Bacteroidales bacterium]